MVNSVSLYLFLNYLCFYCIFIWLGQFIYLLEKSHLIPPFSGSLNANLCTRWPNLHISLVFHVIILLALTRGDFIFCFGILYVLSCTWGASPVFDWHLLYIFVCLSKKKKAIISLTMLMYASKKAKPANSGGFHPTILLPWWKYGYLLDWYFLLIFQSPSGCSHLKSEMLSAYL